MRRSPRLGGRRAAGKGGPARSPVRHPFLFGGGFQPPTHKTSNQAGAKGAGGRRDARDIIIKSICKVGCARSLGRCQRRVVSFAIQAPYLHGRQVDKSYRSPPRSSGE